MVNNGKKTVWTRIHRVWTSEGARGIFLALWIRFWMFFSSTSFWGRLASRMASCFTPPYIGRYFLAHIYKKGYISYSAKVHFHSVRLGNSIFIGDQVTIYQDQDSGIIDIGNGVFINQGTIIQTGQGGSVKIGNSTHIQPNCQFSAYKGSIKIGNGVQIAPNCAFYPYNHGIAPERLMIKQPLTSMGDIIIDDDVWISTGVIILDGVRIGKGAVVGAGSVVTKDIPEGAVAVGNPARVIKMR